MDYHALQQKLFQLDPTDPRKDLAKLQAAASGARSEVPPTKDYIKESVDVPQGTLPLNVGSISDFAALAGIKLKENPVAPPAAPDVQKVGMGAKMVGQRIGAKGGAGQMSKALDKVAQGEALPANLAKQIAPFAKQLEVILSDQMLRGKFMQMVKQAEQMQKSQKSAQPAAQESSKVNTDSIKEMLYQKLEQFKSQK
jgi:hypothetical protein